jgi:hypothetical protein
MRRERKPMPEATYTMWIRKDDGAEKIVARSVSAARALLIALEHGGAGRTTIVSHSGPSRRFWELLRYPPGAGPDPLGRVPAGCAEKVMSASTTRSSDCAADAHEALAEFGRRFLSTPRLFWAGELEPDGERARRRADRGGLR